MDQHAYQTLDGLFGPAYNGPERPFDFTLYFEDTIFTVVPATIFLTGAIARAAWLATRPQKVKGSARRSTKLALLSGFVMVQFIVLLTRATDKRLATKTSTAAAALDFAAACLLFILSSFEHVKSVAPSTLISIYLLISSVLDATRLRTLYSIGGFSAQNLSHLLTVSLLTKFGVLVTETIEKRGILLDRYRHLPPEQTGSIFNRSFFWWINALLKIGFTTNLRADDLFTLDDALSSSKVHARFQQKWTQKRTHGTASLIMVSVDVLKWDILTSAIPRTLLSGARFAQPFLVKATINYISDRKNQPSSHGWGLTGAFFLSYLGVAIFNASYRHLSNRCCVQLRGGLIALLYDKTVELSLTAVDKDAVLTLMSTDINRMVEVLTLFHDTWCGIVDLAIAMYLLYLNLGTACFAPAIVYTIQLAATVGLVKTIPAFQKRWFKAVELRVSFTAALLHSMRNVKLLGLTNVVQNRTQALRLNEIEMCKAYRWVDTIRIVCQSGASTFAPFATFLVYYLRSQSSGQVLNVATAFSVLTILRTIEGPLAYVVYAFVSLASSLSCFHRIQAYLLSESHHDNRLVKPKVSRDHNTWRMTAEGDIQMEPLATSTKSMQAAISLHGCSFSWNANERPVLSDINLTLKNGIVNMVIGPVGCGKSTLLKGILSETPISQGFVYTDGGSIAFADQEPWIRNGTIKDNICGSSQFVAETTWYDEVVSCCALAEDIKRMPNGDDTVVGSKGISLSGGQKARLALARALYSRAHILLLDDVFSGLDNDTEDLIFRRLFARNGPIKRLKLTVILATHAVRRLPYADMIVCLSPDGRVVESGTYAQLMQNKGYVHNLDTQFKERVEESGDDIHAERNPLQQPHNRITSQTNAVTDRDLLLRRTGEWSTWKHWFRSCGYISSVLGVVWGFAWILAVQTPGILVRIFSQNDGFHSEGSVKRFIVLFGLTAAIATVAVLLLAWQMLLVMQPRSSRGFHLDLLRTTLDAPLSFFTKTDLGSVTNRFSQDLNLIDMELPFAWADLVLSSVSAVTGMGLMVASGAGYFAATIPVLLAVMYVIQKFYLRTSRQMRLLDLEEKAPLYTQFGETASGLATIRAFGWAQKFVERNLYLLDQSQRPFYLLLCIQRWLTLVLDLVVTGMVTILMSIIVANRDSIDPAMVGVGLLSAVGLSQSLSSTVANWTQMETSIGAVGRIRDFVRSTENEHLSNEVEEVSHDWPRSGAVTFDDFSASYDVMSNQVLHKIDLDIQSTENVGICGRSGSGKSSTLASLFHLLEYRQGRVIIDGIDIANIPRETLRSRLNVIPQEPWWITTESVRFNMDPWHDSKPGISGGEVLQSERDEIFVSILKRCGVWSSIEAKGGLDAVMTADFLSHGQRQLFCLARALMRNSKIVILDECSASVDIETDQLIQRVVREAFKGCTIIAVAHRLNTIADFDRVVVLEAGKVTEIGNPQQLLQNTTSKFAELYHT